MPTASVASRSRFPTSGAGASGEGDVVAIGAGEGDEVAAGAGEGDEVAIGAGEGDELVTGAGSGVAAGLGFASTLSTLSESKSRASVTATACASARQVCPRASRRRTLAPVGPV